MMMDLMIDVIIRVGLLIASGLLFTFILLAYLRLRNSKLGFITLGFGILFIDSILLIPELMFENFTMGFTDNVHLAIHLIAMIFISIGVLKD
jgi:uncharacterized protein (DUF486 family)